MFIAGLACRPRHHSTPLLADTNTLSHGSQSQITAVHLSKGICQFVVVVAGGDGGGIVFVVVFIAGLDWHPATTASHSWQIPTHPVMAHALRSQQSAFLWGYVSVDVVAVGGGGGGGGDVVVALLSWWWCLLQAKRVMYDHSNTPSHGSSSQITAVHLSKGMCQFVVVVVIGGGGGGGDGGVFYCFGGGV